MHTLNHALCIMALSINSVVFSQDQDISAPDAPVVEIAGETMTREEITSFAQMLEFTEMRTFSDNESLLNEYILTRLHDELETTASATGGAKNPSPYRANGQRQLLRRELQEHVRENVKVEREELEKWHAERVGTYTQPEKIQAYHLFMETSDDNESSAPTQVRKRIDAVKAEADSGTSFGLLAERHSEASSGRNGGGIGWVSRRMPIGPQSQPMNIRLEKALFKLDPGKVSDVVQTSHGLHLLYANDRRTTVVPTVDDLVTSNILPNAVVNDRLTSEMRKLIEQTISQHNARILEVADSQDQMSTSTAVLEIAGKAYTLGDLAGIYGPRFTQAYQGIAALRDERTELLQQVLEDEIIIYAAIDKGIDKRPEFRTELRLLNDRSEAMQKYYAYITAKYPVTDEQIDEAYESAKESLRYPEGDGEVLLIEPKRGTTPAEVGKFREAAKRKADEALARLKQGESFEDVATWLNSQDLATSSTKVPKHILGQAMDTLGRAFDQATAGLNDKGELSPVVQFGNDFVIARLNKRGMSDPLPKERVLPRLRGQVARDNDQKARKKLLERFEEQGKVKYLPASAAYGKHPAEQATN